MTGTGFGRDYGIYLVTDRELCGDRGILDTVRQAVEAGIGCVQYREKHASDAEQLAEIAALAEIIDRRVPLLVNDRLDLAVVARRRGIAVDGVHLGQDDAPVGEARAVLGPDAIVGHSAETIEQITAIPGGVDYIGVGAVHATRTKPDHPPELGIDGFADLAARSPLPCVAIGGIQLADVAPLRRAGAVGAAVVSAICAADDVAFTTAELVRAWGESAST